MKAWPLFLAVCLFAAAFLLSAPSTPDPQADFEALIQRFIQERWEASPAAATEAGITGFDDKLDRELLISQLESSLREEEHRRPWEMEPRLYVPFLAISSLVEKDAIPAPERARHLAARLRAVPELLEQGKKNLQNPPKRLTQETIFQTQGTIRFLKEELPAFAAKSGDAGKELPAGSAELWLPWKGSRHS